MSLAKIGKIVLEIVISAVILWVFQRLIFEPVVLTFFLLKINELVALQIIACLVAVSAGTVISLTLLLAILIMEGK
jgi:hypothetical protein